MPITINGTTGISGVDGSAGTPALQGGDTNTGISFGTDVVIASTGGIERARVDASGRLLIGATSTLATGAPLQVRSDGLNNTTAEFFCSMNTNQAPALRLSKSRGTASSPVEVNNNDFLGFIVFGGYDGATWQEGAYIYAQADGTWTDAGDTTDDPTRPIFSTAADGAASPTERVRITSDGSVLFQNKIISSGVGSAFRPDANNVDQLYMLSAGTGAATLQLFGNNNGSIGSITTSGSTTSFNTSSDYRLKENVAPISDGIARLQQLSPSRFNFISDPTKIVDGFIAHEVQAIVPEAVHGEKDAVDGDGAPIHQGIDQSKLVPLLTAALQEAVARIETLEARITTLEAQP